MEHETPYDVLGVSRDAPLAHIRRKYFELARLHHPDKVTTPNAEEAHMHEELMKRITVAYKKIEQEKQNNTGSFTGGSHEHINPDDWRSVWNDVEQFLSKPNIWELVKDVAVKGIKTIVNSHFVKVPVTMEEVHFGKIKKVRLFLHNIDEPVFISLNVGEYPSTIIKDGLTTIHIEMVLQPHDMYTFDDVLDSWDIFCSIQIGWSDFVLGKKVMLTYLDGSSIDVVLEPFIHYKNPIIINNKGLCGLGDLIISVDLQPPECKKKIWDALSHSERDVFINVCQAMS